MANFNKIILMGNLTRDPQLTNLPSGSPVCEFGVAVNRKWKSKEGEQREEVMFVDCRVFGKQAETFNQYMAKGKPILLEGRLQFDQWEDQQGNKRSKHRVFVERFTFVGSRDDQGGQEKPRTETAPSDDYAGGEDIPF